MLAGFARSLVTGHRMTAPKLGHLWLVVLAFIPQFFAFQLPATRAILSDDWIPLILIGSQLLLLVFTVINLRHPGFWLLGLGLVLNLTVIILNGGWMPISPETVRLLAPNAPAEYWKIGERLAVTKDKIVPQTDTPFWFLADRFVLPGWTHLHTAFSIGDVLIAIGAIYFLWSLGGPGE